MKKIIKIFKDLNYYTDGPDPYKITHMQRGGLEMITEMFKDGGYSIGRYNEDFEWQLVEPFKELQKAISQQFKEWRKD